MLDGSESESWNGCQFSTTSKMIIVFPRSIVTTTWIQTVHRMVVFIAGMNWCSMMVHLPIRDFVRRDGTSPPKVNGRPCLISIQGVPLQVSRYRIRLLQDSGLWPVVYFIWVQVGISTDLPPCSGHPPHRERPRHCLTGWTLTITLFPCILHPEQMHSRRDVWKIR